MAPPSWASDKQLQFLNSQYAAFLDHQKRNKLLTFSPVLEHQWFTHYPEHKHLFGEVDELTDIQKKELTLAINARKWVRLSFRCNLNY